MIPTTEQGREKFDWWPDWKGRSIAIVASGPSTKKANVGQLRGRLPLIAIKENYEICPWAEIVYGCDRAWWRNCGGLPKYAGVKLTANGPLTVSYPDIRCITVLPVDDRLLVDKPGVIGSGGNSGFQALNLAVQFGAKRILLVGFDMSDRAGVHWYGRNRGQGRSNPGEWNFRRWRVAFENAQSVLIDNGVEVINASIYTVLTCFPRAPVEKVLAEWGL